MDGRAIVAREGYDKQKTDAPAAISSSAALAHNAAPNILDDLANPIPISVAEVEAVETYLASLLDSLLEIGTRREDTSAAFNDQSGELGK